MTIILNAKCNDLCEVVLYGGDEEEIARKCGYVPDIIPNYYHDYIVLEIDLPTGRILNWNPPTPEQILAFMGEAE